MSDETNPTEPDVTETDATDTDVTEAVATEPEATEAPATEVPAAAPTAAKATATVTTAKESKAVDTDDTRANPRKVREGIVVSDKMDSTLVVAVNERVSHARYGKTVQRTKKLYVHDEKNEAKLGDRVRVQETRPLSKLKRWRLTEVVERAR
jgi:small subunit ribosomal protein S17